MSRRKIVGAIAVLAMLVPAVGLAAGREQIDALAAGFRVPIRALWVIGPMLMAIAAAVTVGWRRAVTGSRTEATDN